MKSFQSMTIVVAATCLLGAAAAAQPGVGRGAGRGSGSRMYDPKTVVTVSGVVQRLDQVKGKGRGGGYGLHALLKADGEEIAVHLGPGWYVEQQALKLTPGDRVEVRGSRITYEGKPAIIAAEVKKGEQTLQLRDSSGVPLWSGPRPPSP